jgi:hypothetical protein
MGLNHVDRKYMGKGMVGKQMQIVFEADVSKDIREIMYGNVDWIRLAQV